MESSKLFSLFKKIQDLYVESLIAPLIQNFLIIHQESTQISEYKFFLMSKRIFKLCYEFDLRQSNISFNIQQHIDLYPTIKR